MAPSSEVLQSDNLIMDDAHNLEDRVDMTSRIHVSSTTPSPLPAQKRVRYARSENEPTASDFAQLEPVIQPCNRPEVRSQSGLRSGSRNPVNGKRSTGDPLSPTSHGPSTHMPDSKSTVIYSDPAGLEDPGSSRPSSDSPPVSRLNAPNDNMEVDQSDSDKANSSRPTSSRSSSLFMPSHPAAAQRRNSTTCNKKGVQRPVRIQLIDGPESEQLQEQVRRASTSEQSSAWIPDQGQLNGDDAVDDANPMLLSDTDSEGDIALPREDPSIHDWDVEELDDMRSESDATSSTRDSSPMPQTSRRVGGPSRLTNTSIRKEAVISSPDTEFELRRPTPRSRHSASSGRDRDDDDWDPLLDPEREVPAMSEDQEADLYNVHLRQENQREFQDAAGLDLGEDDAQAVNEDGQYGGTIEDDDEGEDYWENR
ncbi:hypothetical protein BGX31_003828 [Mortierella sp. GBA43]|nr:hypothetical protein BGX31_003828 [Mortierella sp. GBA43]